MSANAKSFLDLINKREKLEGTKIANMQRNLAVNLYSVRRNFEDLILLLDKYEKELELWSVENREKYEEGIWELHRLLDNYLSSIYSLIEHSIQFCKVLKCPELDHAYREKKDELLNWDCAKFVRDLRTFSQHIGLPLLVGQIHSSPTEFRQTILLQKDELLKWQKWSNSSKKYIASKKEVQLTAILKEYQGLLNDFYYWFYGKTCQIYEKQLKELSFVEEELNKFNPTSNAQGNRGF
jgi:hypothetical protein